jgi:acyl-coenzyme A synthetase/AMP-(fatty) acid ligase
VITSAAYRRAELPKAISGKIRRVELRERELDRGG